MKDAGPDACACCGSTDFWSSVYVQRRCRVCHPPGPGAEAPFSPSQTSALEAIGSPPVHSMARSAERAASKRMAATVGDVRKRVLSMIQEAGMYGITPREAGELEARRCGVDANDVAAHRRIAPRFTELKDAGLIRTIGRRDRCEVWVTT